MWIFNLGNLYFQTVSQHPENYSIDLYERYMLKIEQISIEYHWTDDEIRSVKVLKDIEMNLEIGV